MQLKWRPLAGLVRSLASSLPRARKLAAGFGLTALTVGSVLTASAVGVSASARGDVWTQPHNQAEETPKGHSQEVHLPYDTVDIWGDRLDPVTGQQWWLYHLPPPNPPGPDTLVATGTYSTDGSRQKIGEIPKSIFTNAPGPHFKIEVNNNGDKKSKTFWVEGGTVQPTFFTTPRPETATVGALLKDSATIDGNLPTGTISFTLYGPTNVAVHTETVTIDDSGTYATPTGHVADLAGAWHWKADYSGDTKNDPATSLNEPVTVNKAVPAIITAQSPEAGVVGTTLQDAATLTGGYHPSGTITFYLNNPSGVKVYQETVGVASGNGTYSTAAGFAAGAAGTWHWWAEYNGDANNNKVSSNPADEPVVITEGEQPTGPTITTAPLPTTTAIGARLKDRATLSGGDNPTGSITFTLYDPSNAAAHIETVAVNGNGTYTTPVGHIANKIGVWHWKAAYSGDQNNTPAASEASDEPVSVAGGQVLAETAMTAPLQSLALGLIGLGFVAMVAALAWRRRNA